MAEPPAKKARLEGDSPSNEPLSIDAPSSPVDDFDDDFYETSHAELAGAAGAQGDEEPFSSSAFPAEPASTATSLIPGLGFWGDTSTQHQHQHQHQQPLAHTDPSSLPNGDAEDGELSDTDAFYGGGEKQGSAVAAPEGASQHRNGPPALAAPVLSSGSFSANEPRGSPLAESNASADAHTQEDEGRIEFLQAARANEGNEQAEWQPDSDASESDSSDSSSSDSSSGEDSSEDGELLSPGEAIKRMMAEDPEDDAPAQKAKIKTQNELDEQFTKPDIQVTENTKMTALGKVENIVDNLVLVKANTNGNYYVLESGSAVCLENRTVIGQVSETIGRVQDPRYSVGFADAAEIATLDITVGTPVYYVDEHSKFVFTEPLRKEKHTDASGQYDEETNQQDFSDDEEEAMHKREIKEKKMERKRKLETFHDDAQPSAHTDLPYADTSKDSRESAGPSSYSIAPLKYDDDDDDEDLGMYKPLARPDRFEEYVGAGAPIEDRSHVRRGNMRGRGGWGDRGRGFRGRGAMGGGRGDRTDRGGHNGGGRGDRFDRGGTNSVGGRGDRAGHNNRGRGDRGGNNNRGDRGGRSQRGQYDTHARYQERGRQESGSPHDNRQGHRGAFSQSPARQNQGRQQHPQHSPPRGKGKNRKRNRRDSPDRSSQPPAAANVNAYANNNARTGAEWNPGHSVPTPASYASTPPAASVPTAYATPAYYPQQAQSQTTPAQAQMNMAQWIQLAAAMSYAQQNQGQQQAVPPPPPPPQPQQQPQAQYSFPFQHQQVAAPSANPPQASAQPTGNQPSLQDILRALGNGS